MRGRARSVSVWEAPGWFSLIDCISVGVDGIERLEPMQKQVQTGQRNELTDVTAKVVIYEAFVEGKLEGPKHLARSVRELYFEPKYEEFRGIPRCGLLLCCSLHYQREGESLPGVELHGCGKSPVFLIVLGDRWRGRRIIHLSQT